MTDRGVRGPDACSTGNMSTQLKLAIPFYLLSLRHNGCALYMLLTGWARLWSHSSASRLSHIAQHRDHLCQGVSHGVFYKITEPFCSIDAVSVPFCNTGRLPLCCAIGNVKL